MNFPSFPSMRKELEDVRIKITAWRLRNCKSLFPLEHSMSTRVIGWFCTERYSTHSFSIKGKKQERQILVMRYFASLLAYICSPFNYLQQHTLTCMLPHAWSWFEAKFPSWLCLISALKFSKNQKQMAFFGVGSNITPREALGPSCWSPVVLRWLCFDLRRRENEELVTQQIFCIVEVI